ncbi:MAG TPA: hypothetical protein VEP29_09980 [Desulfatiglandales bacterium]|nr:hypothetical protein [Desulfatiglandales bacterium]
MATTDLDAQQPIIWNMTRIVASHHPKAFELFQTIMIENINFASVFTGLLGSMDEAAKGLINRRLEPRLPVDMPSQKAWFESYLPFTMENRKQKYFQGMAINLKKTLVFQSGLSPIGLLRSCLDFALNDPTKIAGVFEAVREQFRFQGARKLLEVTNRVNEFRNTWVAHQERELTDGNLAKKELLAWVEALKLFSDQSKEG